MFIGGRRSLLMLTKMMFISVYGGLLTFLAGDWFLGRVDEAYGSGKCLKPLYLLDRCIALLVVDWHSTESVTRFHPFNMW